MLTIKDITKQFSSGGGTVTAVDKASLSVDAGKFVSIIGKSGSGKSTLLAILGALDKPSNGSIEVDGRDITQLHDRALIKYRRATIGFIFQSYNLIPNLTALQNVMLPLEFSHKSRASRRARAVELLNEVGLTADKQNRRPAKLSGGEQQRVAIARALANKPKLILADEPTGNLDSATGKMIFELLHKLTRTEGTTIIVVTHDLAIAGKTDQTFLLRDGKLVSRRG